MIFQNININAAFNNNEVIQICTQHPECKDCPLKEGNMNIQNFVVICETGRSKSD